MNERDVSGYTVAYDRGEAQFPVWVMAVAAAILLPASAMGGGTVSFVLGLAAGSVAYFNYPLLETGRPRLGANQYGVFIEGFGVIAWRAIDKIDLVPIAVRALTINELQIALKQPLGTALVADWRRLPAHRMLMRLPWSMTHNNVVRVNLEPFEGSPEEIHRTLARMWRHYRS